MKAPHRRRTLPSLALTLLALGLTLHQAFFISNWSAALTRGTAPTPRRRPPPSSNPRRVPQTLTRRHTPRNQTAPPATPPRTCLLYDRPPRTASTTAGQALQECVRGKGYVEPSWTGRDSRETLVSRLGAVQWWKVAAVASHVHLAAGDAAAVRNLCPRLLYVTSAAPMRRRLWSVAKFKVARKTRVLDAVAVGRAQERVGRAWRADEEEALERYPYVDGGVSEGERLVPDYVLRAGVMQKDLGDLLEALGCEREFESQNEHAAGVGVKEIVDDIQLDLGDATFKSLSKLALRNKKGLEKARLF